MHSRTIGVLALLLVGLVGCSAEAPPDGAPGDGEALAAATGPGTAEAPPTGDDAPDERPPPVRACSALAPRAVPLEISILPDAGTAPFTSVLERATRSIRVMVYQMGYGPILDTLEAKARAGVKVQVILDLAQQRTNQKYLERLVAAGAEVAWSDPAFTYMHAKLLVVDEREALISTGNYHVAYMTKERNFAVLDRDPEDVAQLTALFDADFARRSPDLSCTRLLVAPVNAKERLLELVRSATREILVESMQLGERDVRDALAERKRAGVDVRVLLADPSWIDANADAATFLAASGIPARWLGAPSVHAKAIVVDGERAYAGSINLSWTSLAKNREVGVVATEAAGVGALRGTFERDWAAASAFATP